MPKGKGRIPSYPQASLFVYSIDSIAHLSSRSYGGAGRGGAGWVGVWWPWCGEVTVGTGGGCGWAVGGVGDVETWELQLRESRYSVGVGVLERQEYVLLIGRLKEIGIGEEVKLACVGYDWEKGTRLRGV